MDIYEELGTIQVEPFDTFNEELDEMVEYYGRILQISGDEPKMQKLLEYCVQYYNTHNYIRFLYQIRRLNEKQDV